MSELLRVSGHTVKMRNNDKAGDSGIIAVSCFLTWELRRRPLRILCVLEFVAAQVGGRVPIMLTLGGAMRLPLVR